MDRDRIRAAALALVGVLAVALAATALPSPRRASSGGPGTGGGGGGVPLLPAPSGGIFDVPFLTELVVLVAVVGLLLGLARALEHPREAAKLVALFGVLAVVGVVLVEVLSAALRVGGGPPLVRPFRPPQGAGGGGGGGDGIAGGGVPPLPVLVLAALFGLVAAVAVFVAARRRRDAGSGGEDEDVGGDGQDGSTAAAVGRAAGRAADRLAEGGDLDNEVYRAWREMTGLLEVPRPAVTAPGEFAEAAVDAGMDPDDVDELTRLFEVVRYGGRDPTPGDERRARAVLERIESSYAGDESDDPSADRAGDGAEGSTGAAARGGADPHTGGGRDG